MTQPANSKPTSLPGPAPEIVVEDLHKGFGGRRVLRGVNLRVERGEMLAIVGGSGSGKTVLLKHLTGQLVPDRGRVLVAHHGLPGSPLRDLALLGEEALDDLRRHWAVVFQHNALFSGSVFDNLALWPREIKEQTDAEILPLARRALADVGLDPEQVMHRKRSELSGGMAKRVAIARALVMDPAIIFYDEPTAGLDPATAEQIHELIRATHGALPLAGVPRTSIVVTHDTELLSRLRPRVVMLEGGGVLFDGDFGSFIASDSASIRPYIEQMPILHARVPREEAKGA